MMSFKSAQVVYSSAARTATPASITLNTSKSQGMLIVIDVSAIAVTPSITVAIAGIDPISGSTFSILTSSAITTVSTVALRVHPALPTGAGISAPDLMPQETQITVTHGDADSITYSVSATLITD